MIRTLVATALLLALAACSPGAVGAGAGRAADDAAAAAVTNAQTRPPEVFSRPTKGPPPPVFQLPMRLVGTEPFWGGRITAGTVTLSGADRPDVAARILDQRHSAVGSSITAEAGAGETYTGLAVALDVETCSDGMSDKRYPLRATVIVSSDPKKPAEVLEGCAIREADFGGER